MVGLMVNPYAVGDHGLRLIVQVVLRPEQTKGFVLLKNAGWLNGLSVGWAVVD